MLNRFVSVVACIVTGEKYIKGRVEKKPDIDGTLIFGDQVEVVKSHNTGSAFGIYKEYPAYVQMASVILCVIMSFAFVLSLSAFGNNTLRWGLSLMLGGAYSNTYDRLKTEYVVDYLRIPSKKKILSQIVFNISDFCLVIGAMLSTFGWMKAERKRKKKNRKR